jgi:hypothetical protein
MIAADSDIAVAGAGVPDYPGIVWLGAIVVVVVWFGAVVVVVEVDVVVEGDVVVLAVALPALTRPLDVGVCA